MAQYFYQLLNSIGFYHPLHPAITHIPVGMVIGAFLFGLMASIFRNPQMAQTARHCIGLALIGLLPTMAVGYLDWQQFYGGAWLAPIQWKLILAGVLAVLLIIALISGKRSDKTPFNLVIIYFLCFCVVIALGYFGGELVYGEKSARAESTEKVGELARKGKDFFSSNCSMCHYTDSEETKIGPGLKNLFDRERLPESDRPVTEENVKKQLTNPYANMPAFEDITPEQLDAVVAYLKTI